MVFQVLSEGDMAQALPVELHMGEDTLQQLTGVDPARHLVAIVTGEYAPRSSPSHSINMYKMSQTAGICSSHVVFSTCSTGQLNVYIW